MPVSEATTPDSQAEPKMSILLVDDRPENLIALEIRPERFGANACHGAFGNGSAQTRSA